MCKEDVKIGRKKEARQIGDSSSSAGGTIVGTGNPNRAAYLLSSRAAFDPTQQSPIMLVRAGNESGPVVCSVGAFNPHIILSVEEYGDAILGPLCFISFGGFDIDFWLAELTWDQPLSEL